MPSQKMKTHKGVKKRFKVTATGKVSHKRCGSSHLNSHKSGKKIRKLRKKSYLKLNSVAARLRITQQHLQQQRRSSSLAPEASPEAAAAPTPAPETAAG
jgi:large subunit ribosomal protein L35